MQVQQPSKWTVAAALVLCAAGTAVAAPNATASSDRASVWERLATCETHSNWAANTGNGYYGGLQFTRGTWRAYGGDQFAEYPHEASPREQVSVAERVHDDRGGYSAWPSCAKKLGLPR